MYKRRVALKDRWFMVLLTVRDTAARHMVDTLDGWADVREVARTQDISVSRARGVLQSAAEAGLMDRYHVSNGTPFGVVRYMPTEWGIKWLDEQIEEMREGRENA